MTFRTMALATILSGATAIPAYALDVGVDGSVGAGVNAAVDSVGDVAASTGANVNADVNANTSANTTAESDTQSDIKTNADSSANADANMDADVDADADVAVDTQGATSTVGTAIDTAANLQIGTPIVTADGQLIGQVETTRETDDGETQAVITVDESADLGAEKIAIDLEWLKKDADGDIEFDRSMAELRAGIEAHAGAVAEVDS